MKTVCTLLALFISLLMIGQTYVIPNNGFENWIDNIVVEPDVFVTSNSMSGIPGGNVTQTTDEAFGNYAVRLETIANLTDTIPGMLIIGIPGGPLGISGGIPFTGTPDSISGYAKFDISPSDNAYVIIAFKKNGSIIAQAIKTFNGTQSSYERFIIPTGLSGGNPPDSLIMLVSSSNLDPPQIPGSCLYLDSITFLHTADTLPNNNFENWTSTDYGSNPDLWSSLNNFTMYGLPVLSFPTNDVHSGISALKMISDTAILQPPFGSGTLDTIAGFVFIGPPDMDNPGIPFNLRPTAMNFYTKCVVSAGSQVYATITLTKWNASLQSREEIGSAMFYSDVSISSYTMMTIPIIYLSAETPDTMQISFMAGNMGPGGIILPGTEYFIDDVSLTIESEIIELNSFLQTFTVFPNPVRTDFHISANSPGNRILTIYNSSGALIKSICLRPNESEVGFSMFPDGLYYYSVYSENGIHLGNGRFVKE